MQSPVERRAAEQSLQVTTAPASTLTAACWRLSEPVSPPDPVK